MSSPDHDSYIGIDLGTSGCRGVAIDKQRRILGYQSLPFPPTRSENPGWAEQVPGDWWQTTIRVINKLLAATPGWQPAAISVDGTSSTLLLADEQGAPLTPGLMYNDQRATEQAAELSTMTGVHETAVTSASSSLAKLMWLLQNHALPRQIHALHQGEWISGKLCGRYDMGDENNCLKLGYDPVTQQWPNWMTRLELPKSILPKVVPVGTFIGHVEKSIARETGLPQTCRVLAGTTDSTAAALASGLEQVGDAMTSLGSTLVCKVLATQPLFNQKYGVYSHRIFGRWLAGGASNVGGAVLRRYFSDDELAILSEHIDPRRSLCLDYYPLREKGERFPTNDPEMQPRIFPVPRDRTRFLQGLLEGITRVEKTGYERLQALGAPYPRQIFTSGGGAGNGNWMIMRERILGHPIHTAIHQEAAYGAALIALKGATQQKTRIS